jgi:hypothetical protein
VTTRDTRPDDQHEPREVVIDSHVHVWDPARIDYPWLVEAPALERRFDVSDIDDELDAARVVAVILVQAADHIDDTHLMLELAASNQRVREWSGRCRSSIGRPQSALSTAGRTPQSSVCAISFTAITIPTCSPTQGSTTCWQCSPSAT